MGDKNRGEYYRTIARKIDAGKESEISEIMDTLPSIRRIKDEPRQKSTPKRQR